MACKRPAAKHGKSRGKGRRRATELNVNGNGPGPGFTARSVNGRPIWKHCVKRKFCEEMVTIYCALSN